MLFITGVFNSYLLGRNLVTPTIVPFRVALSFNG